MLATMNTAPFWVSIALLVPLALAVPADSSAAAAAPSCTASLVTSLCDYPGAGAGFSVASDGKPNCWEYCNDHPPCDFVIFAAGNPHTGTGSCLLYPGQTFDASKGSTDCGNPYLSVYSKPVCAGGSPTATAGACAATASPSPVASVCGYPAPDDDCFSSCFASSSSSDCLSLCAKADSCSYVVFKALNPGNSPYASGNCWIYPEGKFNPGAATACAAPDQFVYNNLDNVCPKPSPTSSSIKSSATAHPTGAAGATTGSTNSASTSSHGTGSTGSSTGSTGTGGDTTGSADGAETSGDTTGSTNGSGTSSNGSGTTGNSSGSNNGSGTSSNGTGTKSNGTETAAASATTTTDSAAAGLSLTNPLAIGAAALMLLAL